MKSCVGERHLTGATGEQALRVSLFRPREPAAVHARTSHHAPRPLFGVLLGLIAAVLVTACVPTDGQSVDRAREATQAPKRIKFALFHDVASIGMSGGNLGERSALNGLTNAGLTNLDEAGTRRPQLAEVVPTLENGLWKLFPDGKMEVSWRIKPNVSWHDGAPFQATDVAFTTRAFQDPQSGLASAVFFANLEGIDTPDAQTVRARWSKAFIYADSLFPQLLPRHVLESALDSSPQVFRDSPFWGKEYVGTGPFRVVEFDPNRLVRLHAFDGYVLGRPKIDEIEISVVADPNTGLASILAGEIDIAGVERGMTIDMALQLRERWKEGRVYPVPATPLIAFPQLFYSDPAIIKEPQFRQALMHALNRQEMTDTLQHGLTPVMDSLFYPDQPQYEAIERTLPKYNYDPRQSLQMLQALGYTRGADGFLRDRSNEKLSIEVRATNDAESPGLSVSDAWRQIGIDASYLPIPVARQRDLEWRATFPGFQVKHNPVDLDILPRFYSSELATAATGWRGADTGYQSPEYDGLLDRYLVTVPRQEQYQILGELARRIVGQLLIIGLFFDTYPTAVKDRMQDVPIVKGGAVTGVASVFSSHLWDVR